jgi:hypothetical protein
MTFVNDPIEKPIDVGFYVTRKASTEKQQHHQRKSSDMDKLKYTYLIQ